MSETLLPLSFTEQGEEGLAHVVIPCCDYDVDESRGVSPAGRVAELEEARRNCLYFLHVTGLGLD
jgi:hypothetical protein